MKIRCDEERKKFISENGEDAEQFECPFGYAEEERGINEFMIPDMEVMCEERADQPKCDFNETIVELQLVGIE